MRFDDIKGSAHVKRALEVAAAGGHTVSLFGDGCLTALAILADGIGIEVVADGADITVEVPIRPSWVNYVGEPHEHVIERIKACRENNPDLPMDDLASVLLRAATKNYSLNPVRVCQVVDVAVTIANLAGAQSIHAAHMAEAIQYVPLELDCYGKRTLKV